MAGSPGTRLKASEVPPKSKRKTSKRWLAVNTVLGWCAIFYGIFSHQAAAVVAPMVGMILQYSFYVLVGHMDFKRSLEASSHLPTPSPYFEE